MDKARISQSLCAALRTVLVNFLNVLGVPLTSVVGQSSGEIAAVYALGQLAARDAIRIAYLREYVAPKAGKKERGARCDVCCKSFVGKAVFLHPSPLPWDIIDYCTKSTLSLAGGRAASDSGRAQLQAVAQLDDVPGIVFASIIAKLRSKFSLPESKAVGPATKLGDCRRQARHDTPYMGQENQRCIV
ncbi:uncharacterized protein BDV17DRAFT_90722 [Aspergillus undulatus]|uniref:uncharacterized protein n=1 Tax=Aspergillus undulatus TaxID=1810928 RepID=UPI003CCCD0F1